MFKVTNCDLKHQLRFWFISNWRSQFVTSNFCVRHCKEDDEAISTRILKYWSSSKQTKTIIPPLRLLRQPLTTSSQARICSKASSQWRIMIGPNILKELPFALFAPLRLCSYFFCTAGAPAEGENLLKLQIQSQSPQLMHQYIKRLRYPRPGYIIPLHNRLISLSPTYNIIRFQCQ